MMSGVALGIGRMSDPYISPVSHRTDHNMIWCEDCYELVLPPCSSHGDLLPIRDRQIPSRARLTLPHHLNIRKLELRAASDDVYGVFAKKVIQKRSLFGPYEGMLTEEWKHNHEDRIQLKLFLPTGQAMYLDCTDEKVCNWMMFVRPANDAGDQNLVVFQYNGAVYFVSTKAIGPNEELRVWYAGYYADQLGKKTFRQMQEHSEQAEEQKRLERSEIIAEVTQAIAHSPVTHRNLQVISDPPGDLADLAGDLSGDLGDDLGEQVTDANGDVQPEVNPSSDSISPAPEKLTSHSEYVQSDSRTDSLDPKLLTCDSCGENLADELELVKHDCSQDSKDIIGGKSKQNRSRKFRNSKTKQTSGKKRPGKPKKSLDNHDGTPKETEPKLKVKVKKEKGSPSSVEKKLVMCEVCGKAFPNESKLKIHSYMHTDAEKPYKCPVEGCGKTFISKYKVERHQAVHSEDRCHVCVYCDKGFIRKDHLKNHLKVHDPNKKVYPCEECGKEYQGSYALRTHLSLHAASRGELQCLVCKQTFQDTDTLLYHLKVHSGARSIKTGSDKQHECHICHKRFFGRKDVRRHMVTHSKTRDFMCHFCPQCFGRKDHLARHLAAMHGQKDTTDTKSQVMATLGTSHDGNNQKHTVVTKSAAVGMASYSKNKVISDFSQDLCIQQEIQPVDVSEIDNILTAGFQRVVDAKQENIVCVSQDMIPEPNVSVLHSNQILQTVDTLPISQCSTGQDTEENVVHSEVPGKVVSYQVIHLPNNLTVQTTHAKTQNMTLPPGTSNQMLNLGHSKILTQKVTSDTLTQDIGQCQILTQDGQSQIVIHEVSPDQVGQKVDQVQTFSQELGQSTVVLDTGQSQQQQQQQQPGYQTVMLSYSDALRMVGQLSENSDNNQQ